MNSLSSIPDRGCSYQIETQQPGLARRSSPSDDGQRRNDGHDTADLLEGHHGGELDTFKSLPKTPVLGDSEALAPAMPPEALAESSALLQQAFAKYGRIVKLQDRFLTVQSRLKSERDTVVAEFHGLKDSIAQFVQLSGTSDAQTTNLTHSSALKLARGQIVADGQAFDDQMRKVIDHEQSLGRLEYRLGELLPDLLELLGSCFPNNESRERRAPSSQSSRSPSPKPPTLTTAEDEYYDKRGSVRLLREQIFNHTDETDEPSDDHITSTYASTQANPPTQVIETPVVHFQQPSYHARWQAEHDKMQSDLIKEEQELKRLWDVCQDAGLDVGELSVELAATPKLEARSPVVDANQEAVELDTPPFLRLDSGGVVYRFIKDLRWPDRGRLLPSTVPNFTEMAEKRDFIERWVGKLPDTIFGSQSSEFKHIVADSAHDGGWGHVHRIDPNGASVEGYGTMSDAISAKQSGGSVRPGDSRIFLRNWRSDEGLRARYSSPSGEESAP